jgi:hypothetical protein
VHSAKYKILLVGFVLSTNAHAGSASSEAVACALLKRAAVTYHLSRHNLAGRYYCDALPERDEYYVLGLRYQVREDELVGSNLIGWFAIRKRDGLLMDWDINEDIPRPLSPRPPFE